MSDSEDSDNNDEFHSFHTLGKNSSFNTNDKKATNEKKNYTNENEKLHFNNNKSNDDEDSDKINQNDGELTINIDEDEDEESNNGNDGSNSSSKNNSSQESSNDRSKEMVKSVYLECVNTITEMEDFPTNISEIVIVNSLDDIKNRTYYYYIYIIGMLIFYVTAMVMFVLLGFEVKRIVRNPEEYLNSYFRTPQEMVNRPDDDNDDLSKKSLGHKLLALFTILLVSSLVSNILNLLFQYYIERNMKVTLIYGMTLFSSSLVALFIYVLILLDKEFLIFWKGGDDSETGEDGKDKEREGGGSKYEWLAIVIIVIVNIFALIAFLGVLLTIYQKLKEDLEDTRYKEYLNFNKQKKVIHYFGFLMSNTFGRATLALFFFILYGQIIPYDKPPDKLEFLKDNQEESEPINVFRYYFSKFAFFVLAILLTYYSLCMLSNIITCTLAGTYIYFTRTKEKNQKKQIPVDHLFRLYFKASITRCLGALHLNAVFFQVYAMLLTLVIFIFILILLLLVGISTLLGLIAILMVFLLCNRCPVLFNACDGDYDCRCCCGMEEDNNFRCCCCHCNCLFCDMGSESNIDEDHSTDSHTHILKKIFFMIRSFLRKIMNITFMNISEIAVKGYSEHRMYVPSFVFRFLQIVCMFRSSILTCLVVKIICYLFDENLSGMIVYITCLFEAYITFIFFQPFISGLSPIHALKQNI